MHDVWDDVLSTIGDFMACCWSPSFDSERAYRLSDITARAWYDDMCEDDRWLNLWEYENPAVYNRDVAFGALFSGRPPWSKQTEYDVDDLFKILNSALARLVVDGNKRLRGHMVGHSAQAFPVDSVFTSAGTAAGETVKVICVATNQANYQKVDVVENARNGYFQHFETNDKIDGEILVDAINSVEGFTGLNAQITRETAEKMDSNNMP